MPYQAKIKINGTIGSNADLPIGSLVELSNADLGDESTYQWTLVSKPANSGAALSSSTLPTSSFTADAEGTYLIRLVVDAGLPSEATDQVIAAVRELQTRNRIPAAGETIENNAESDDTGWAHEAVDQILQRVTRLTDAGYIVAQAGESLVAGNLVRFTGLATIGDDARDVPVVTKVTATTSVLVSGTIGYVAGAVAGGAIVTGTLCRVLLNGVIENVNIGTSALPSGVPLYLSNVGTFSHTSGTYPRLLGVTANETATSGTYNVSFSGYGTSTPFAAATGDLSGSYPAPTVAKISGVTLGVSAPVAGQVLRATSTSAASWGAVDLANANAVTGTLPINRGGTGASSTTEYGVIYAASATAYTALALPADSSKFLRGRVGTTPTWDRVDLATADVTGTLTVGNGGTGVTIMTANRLLLGNGGSPIAALSAGTSSQVLRGNAAGAPTWGTVPTGAFASNTIPYSSIQVNRFANNSTGLITITASSYPSVILNLLNFPLTDGNMTFGIMPRIKTATTPNPMTNVVTCLTNNHSATVYMRYVLTKPGDTAFNADPPPGFNNDQRVYEQKFQFPTLNANHIAGSIAFPIIVDYTATASAAANCTLYAEVRVETTGNEQVELADFTLFLVQG